ncbi:cellulose binding domain-containing protein [Streptomyces sp. H10-C2]|uniref:cellulose binding domain-containing protein n=1 Tax=unclassified Streptomyces TaxID=2593676 RepID=UPI0024BABDE1|nr:MULTISPECIES: cellulose binding domain-containing protein [unclassified Streptomyces]MDJ0346056.1 cellulose binding domain-containing protein [Streptomyces sp. PH10-H1]MDJ0373032.1 cellulose binding domain-containing protein [Streptomyces sp. H10-C2]
MRRSLTLVLALFGTLVLFLSSPATAAGGVSAAFTKTSDWGSGYQAQYQITNGSGSTLTSWKVEFDLPSGSTVGSYWDALLTQSGSHFTFTNRDYNGTLTPGASAIFGWVGAGAATPLNCKLNGGSCDAGGGGGDTTPPSVPGGVTIGSATGSLLTVHWTASTDDSGSVAGYEVSRDGASPVAVTGTSYTATGLQPTTTYSFRIRAKDAAGNTSAYSAAVSGTTSTGGGSGTVHTAPYVDMGAWPTPSMPDMASASGLRSFTMAFITASGCKAMWFNAYDPRAGWAKDQVDAIRAVGGDVKISFGGASGSELAQACTTVDSLYAEYDAVVNAYGLTYADFDIEGAATADPASISRRSQALARLQQAHPGLRISLTLPVLPEGLTADGITLVKSARDAGVTLDVVNVMAMDYYRATDYGDAAVQAAQSTQAQLRTLYPGKTDAQLWAMTGVTPMLGQNDDGHIFDQTDSRQLVSFAQGKHLGVLGFWETTRDRNACNGALYMCTNVPQTPYEFSKIFAQYTG